MMEEEVQAALKSGVTTEPTLRAIFLAEQINRRNSGAVVKPWEIEEVPEDFIIGYRAIFNGIEKNKKHERLEGLFRSFRARHPTYRKYTH